MQIVNLLASLGFEHVRIAGGKSFALQIIARIGVIGRAKLFGAIIGKLYKSIFQYIFMKRSSRRWKKKRQMRWKWQRKRLKKEKRKRKLKRSS